VKPYPVLIEWHDAADFGEGWVSLDDVEDDHVAPCDVITVGWLVQKSKRALVLALSISEAMDGRGLFVVPRACVKKVTRLSPKVPRPTSRS